MAPMRNLVRAWEMRNDWAFSQGYSWNEVSGIDQHPADMTVLAQGAVMTPTIMKAGQWNTWSYADLMDPVTLLALLKKDCKGHDSLTELQRKCKVTHVIVPLLDTLGFKLVMGLNNKEWIPQSGADYYTFLEADTVHLKKKIQVPDASVFVNHEVFHLVVQLPTCDGRLQFWRSRIEAHLIFSLGVNIPSRVASRKIVEKAPENENRGVQKALLRYQTLNLHGLLTTVPNWDKYETYMDRSMEELQVWRRPTNQQGVEMSSTFLGRTPLTFVRSVSPTRKKEEEASQQEEAAKRRKLDDKATAVTAERNMPMDVSTPKLSTDVLSHREDKVKTIQDERAEWMDIDEEVDIEISPTEEMRVMGDDE
eukprot:4786051-Amphidinium_carterae.1